MTNEPVDILLVDDHPESLISVESVLGGHQYRLVKAFSGAEALRKILVHDFAVILLDVQMPEMDGFETAQIIKQRDRSRHIPIIFVTAINKFEKYVTHGYEVGAVDYLFKPFDPSILRSKVAVFVDLYRKSRQLVRQAEALRELTERESTRVLADLEKENRRKYQYLADAIPHVVWRSDHAGQFESYNHFWYSYTGMSPEERSREGWAKICHSDDLRLMNEKWEKSKRSSTGFEIECRLWHPHSQRHRWHLLKVIPELNGDSLLTGWIGTATDIDDQKKAHQELWEAKEMADSANLAKSSFLANMSHEIRTPLGAMLGFVDLLVTNELTEEKKDEYRKIIHRNGEQLRNLIDEILDLSKIEAGKTEFECIEISIIDWMNDTQSLLSLGAQEKGIDLKFQVVETIPTQIVTDPHRLRQIFMNIVGNAIKFSPVGGEVTVLISYDEISNHLMADVIDSGPGIRAGQIATLFQPFCQLDGSMSRKFGGTGLGLALSRRLARALGGDITVDDQRTEPGARFKVKIFAGLPAAEKRTGSLAVYRTSDHTQAAVKYQKDSLMGMKVLLVEDTADNQILVTQFLRLSGADVEVAANGHEGVQMALSNDFDVVLMDLQMPVMDGYLATKTLREKGYQKPIIALTAHAMSEERQRSLAVGCNEHLTKPMQRERLIQCLLKVPGPV
ncbi:MAG: hypothetical protein C5B49_07045 [Bdellovibrio sp.]|nr:MAG: hypothetical protein C5B49_07045 [Bdellovibrio sp.]